MRSVALCLVLVASGSADPVEKSVLKLKHHLKKVANSHAAQHLVTQRAPQRAQANIVKKLVKNSVRFGGEE